MGFHASIVVPDNLVMEYVMLWITIHSRDYEYMTQLNVVNLLQQVPAVTGSYFLEKLLRERE